MSNFNSTGKPSYSKDLWDAEGWQAITNRVEESKKAMKFIQSFFQDSVKNSLNTAQTMAKVATTHCSQYEIGTLQFSLERFVHFVEMAAKSAETLGSKFRLHCQQKLMDQMKTLDKTNSKLLTELGNWHKQLQKENKQLSKAEQNYEEKKAQFIAAEQALQNYMAKQAVAKTPQAHNNTMTLQTKLANARSQSREAKDQYLTAVKSYRGFRLRFDSSTTVLLEQLEHTEVERAKEFHKLLNAYLECQQSILLQNLKYIETTKAEIADLNPYNDNIQFIEKARTNLRKPPLPDPKLHYDDIDAPPEPSPELEEETIELKQWCEKWRLVISKILGRDVELSLTKLKNHTTDNNNRKHDSETNSYPVIDLSPQEFETLKAQCIESFNCPGGRMGFAILLNRQRNADHGLELARTEFFELAKLVEKFCDSVKANTPIDVKPAKLVMIMTQSLYVRKENILDILTPEEKKELEVTKNTTTNTNSKVDDTNTNDSIATEEKKDIENTTPEDNEKMVSKQHKLFLVDLIKDHPLWKSETFWKEAFWDGIQQEFKKYPTLEKWHSSQEQMEADRRNQEITFGQLAAITHNMKEFGIKNSTILNFLDAQNLSPDKIGMLKATLGVFEDEKANDRPNTIVNTNNVNHFDHTNNTANPISTTSSNLSPNTPLHLDIILDNTPTEQENISPNISSNPNVNDNASNNNDPGLALSIDEEEWEVLKNLE